MSTLSKLSAVAVVLGLAACGGNRSPQANAPNPNYGYAQTPSTPSPSEQYGSAMGQGGATGTETGGPSTGTPSSGMPSTGSTTGQGMNDQYGSQYGQGAGSQYGAGGQGAGSMGSQQPYGAGQGGATGAPSQYGGQPGSAGSQPGGTQYGSTGTTSAMGGGPMDVSNLNDAQIAAIIIALDQGELQEAQLAQSKAQSPEVKRLAQHLMTAHQNNLTKSQATFSRLQITPSDNAVSQQLQSDAQNDMSNLGSMRGRDFDRDFVQVTIKGHNQAIELVDRILPNVKNAELKTELQNLRPKLQDHLQQAERAQTALQRGSTNKQGGGSSTGQQPQH